MGAQHFTPCRISSDFFSYPCRICWVLANKGYLCLAYMQTWGQLQLYHPWLAKYTGHLKMALLLYCLSGSICCVCCGLFTACFGDSSGNWKAEPSPFFPNSQGVPVPADVAGCWRSTASVSHIYSPRDTALGACASAGPRGGVQTTACICRAGSQEENIVSMVYRVPLNCACSPTHSLSYHGDGLRVHILH